MRRSLPIIVICLLAAGCAHVPVERATLARPVTLASSATLRVSAELECMSDCLGESDGSGEACMRHCLD